MNANLIKTDIAEIELVLQRVLQQERQIGVYGMSSGDRYGKPQELIKYLKEIAICRQWLGYASFRKTVNTRHTSYRYKHLVEDWANTYIPNGAFIVAGISLDIPYKRVRFDSPNAYFAISEKCLVREASGRRTLKALLAA